MKNATKKNLKRLFVLGVCVLAAGMNIPSALAVNPAVIQSAPFPPAPTISAPAASVPSGSISETSALSPAASMGHAPQITIGPTVPHADPSTPTRPMRPKPEPVKPLGPPPDWVIGSALTPTSTPTPTQAPTPAPAQSATSFHITELDGKLMGYDSDLRMLLIRSARGEDQEELLKQLIAIDNQIINTIKRHPGESIDPDVVESIQKYHDDLYWSISGYSDGFEENSIPPRNSRRT